MLPSAKCIHLFSAILVGICAVVPAHAQLQSPSEFLGYELGTRFTRHHQVVDYFKHVAENSNIVEVAEYGETYEGRKLIYATMSSPENMSRLEEIRIANLQLAGQSTDESPQADIAIVWLSYGVHGNESVSTEASMATLYEFANPQNSRSAEWLSNTVVIIDPCLNPDGRDRYVNWFNQVSSESPDANWATREHRELWPGGRTNHYMFDINRDWSWATQKETRQRLEVYLQWLPQVHVDFHEQGFNSPYYFAPGAEPLHENVTDWQRAFQKTVATNHAKYFDKEGWLYFTAEVFDLLYPGYGDTWPMFHGGIGMTYEQAGGGSAGLAVKTETGDTLTLGDRIAHHKTTGLSTVEVTSDNRADVLREFQRYFQDGQTNPPGVHESYVVPASNDEDKIERLVTLLEAQGIQYGRAETSGEVRGFSYTAGREGSHRLSSEDLVIPARQPFGTFVKVLFEPSTVVADSVTYDITSWSIPYVYGLDAFAVEKEIPFVPREEREPATAAGPADAYAYLSDWTSFDDARLLAALTQEGIKTRFSMVPFTMNGREYPSGSIVALRGDNLSLKEFSSSVRKAAERVGQPLVSVPTGMVEAGSDFGSGNVRFMETPLVATLAGDGISPSSFGEVWHYFEEQLDYPVSVFDVDDFNAESLNDVDVLVLPNGSYGRLITDELRKKIRDWVRRGGTLIAMEGAINSFAGKEGFSLAAAKKADTDTTVVLKKYGDRRRESRSAGTSGSVYRVNLDNSHPLAFGYGDQYFTLKRSAIQYPFSNKLWNVGTIAQDGYVTGFAGAKAKAGLQDVIVFATEEIGSGRVVYMVDNPLFRGFWENGKLLFANAVFRVGK